MAPAHAPAAKRMARTLPFAAALMVGMAMPIPADHVQMDSGRIVVFDHLGGNEWWLEARLAGQDGGQVSSLQARDDGGAWTAMAWKPDWGKWTASFHVEPGHRVQFRASWTGGAMQESCWFTHPAGAEQCGGTPSPFDATFTLVKGNEWWVQSQVTPNAGHSVAAVDVRSNNGAWMPLQKQSWGVREWAASYHFPQGAVLQLRATDQAGAVDLSGCYQWIPPQTGGQDAQQVACPPTGAFAATFSGVKGNEWWVEATVKGTHPVARVEARLGCSGPWHPLQRTDWGTWAASFRVLAGTHVDFRATSTTGATDISDNAYIWPQATRTDGCEQTWPRDSSHAQFRFRANEQWDDTDGHHTVTYDGLVTTSYDGFTDTWDGTCEVRRTHTDGSGATESVLETWEWDQPPPEGQLPAPVGSTADVRTAENCASVLYPDMPVTEHQTRTFSLRTSSGDPVPVSAVHAHTEGPTHDYDFWWDTEHGLVLSFTLDSMGGSNSRHAEGWLMGTDAQMPS